MTTRNLHPSKILGRQRKEKECVKNQGNETTRKKEKTIKAKSSSE
jgi:hypothetical protein